VTKKTENGASPLYTPPLRHSVTSPLSVRHSAAAAALGRLAAPAPPPAAASAGAAAAIAGMVEKGSMGQLAERFMRGDAGGVGPALVEPLDPYQGSLWFNKCVKATGRTCGGIPARLARSGPGLGYRAKSFAAAIRPSRARSLRPIHGAKGVCIGRAAEGEVVESGDAYNLLDRPNSLQDLGAMIAASVSFYVARGRVAWILESAAGLGRRPLAIHVVDGRRVEPVVEVGQDGLPVLLGYNFRNPKTGAPIPLAPDEVKYFACWAGTDNPLEGLAPNVPGRFAVATDYAASMFNAAMLSRNGHPGLHIDFPNALTPEQRDDFKRTLRERHGGPAKAGQDLITEGGAKADSFQSNFVELQFDQGKATTRLEICALLDVPPFVAGFMDAAMTGSSAYVQNALKHYYEDTIFPILDMFRTALQEIVSRFGGGEVVWFDVEDQPIAREMRRASWETVDRAWAKGVPLADLNDLFDLGLPDQPWYAMGFLPSGLLPAADVASGGGFSPVPEGPPPGGSDTIGQEPVPPKQRSDEVTKRRSDEVTQAERSTRDRIWQAWARSWAPLAQQLRAVLRSHWFAQERKLLTALRIANCELRIDESVSVNSQSSILNPQLKDVQLDQLLIEVFADPHARSAFTARIRSALKDGQELGLRQALSEAGLKGDELKAALNRLLSNPAITEALKSESIIVSTKIDERTRRELKARLEEGLSQGEDTRKLTDRIEEYFGGRRGQAMAVARNTIGQTLSKARHAGAADAGMTHKIWLHTRAPEAAPRPGHVAAEAVYAAAPCPAEVPFEIARDDGSIARLMYPRDPACGDAGEIVNCQCLAIYKRIDAAEGAKEILEAALKAGFVGVKP
jgi:phage portal protein BeeE